MRDTQRRVKQAIIAFMFILVGSAVSAFAGTSELAREFSVRSNTAWENTGLPVSIGDRVTISATGLISIGCDSCPEYQTPVGQPIKKLAGDDRPFVAPGLYLWSLVGKIGASRPFEVGSEATFVSPNNGILKLSVNDNSFGDNYGEWTVSVKIAEASAQLNILSPFRLNAPDLANLDLQVLVPGLGDFSDSRAAGLVADSTSTAIALWETSTQSSVVFTTSNGTSLAAYQQDFLTKAPGVGSQTLTIPGSNLITIGDKFYAAALVQAPARGAQRSLTTPAVITATQDGLSPGTAFLDLKLPPVLLIHGLWGDRASLSTTYDYLSTHSPWDEDLRLLSRIEYQRNLRFDDALITATVADAVESLLGILNSKRIIGGRVDVVGHSMGGLIVRYYSKTPLYRAPHNRQLGQFHAVMTLDTPELGSAMASYLIGRRNAHATAPLFSEASLVWLTVCGSRSATVAECFEDNSMPIFGPTDGLVRGGAVWSLVPLSISLNRAPSFPSIAGLIWADVTAIVRDKDESQLRWIISKLIQATYSDPDSAPSPTDILGGANDVIVSFASQANGSTRANRIKFLGLDHSALRFEGFDLNNGINNSDKVSDYVACWFEKEGDPSCIPSLPISGPAPAAVRTATVVPRVVDQLVQAPQKAEIGVPLPVTGIVNAKGVRRVVIYQRNDFGKASPDPEQVSPFSFVGHRLHFEIKPRLLGRVTFEIHVTLADSSKLVQRLVRNVTVRNDALRELHGHGSQQVFLFMSLGKLPLTPFGLFKNVNEEVPLDGQVKYSVLKSLESSPAVRVEGNTLLPLRPGSARVLARLGSKIDILHVTVNK